MPVASVHRSSPHATISPSPSLSLCRCRRRGQRSRALLADGDGFDTRNTIRLSDDPRDSEFFRNYHRDPCRSSPQCIFFADRSPLGGGGCRGTEPLRGCGAQPIGDLACTEASHHCSGRGRMRWMLWN